MPAYKSSTAKPAHFLGLELGITQLAAVIVDEQLEVVLTEAVEFDRDLPEYSTKGGVFKTHGEWYTTAVDMWVKALDILLDRLRDQFDLSKIRSIGGAAQTALVWWSDSSEDHLRNLTPEATLYEQLGTGETFSLLHTSTSLDTEALSQAQTIEASFGGPDAMAARMGLCTHTSLPAAYAMKIREGNPEVWSRTGHLGTAASFLASILIGRWAPMSDGEAACTGMYVLQMSAWDDSVLRTIAGSGEEATRLRRMLGDVAPSHGQKLGTIHPYFSERFGFTPDTFLIPFTSDSLSTYASLCPSADDAVLSFGPFDVLLTPAPQYSPSRYYTLIPHPAQDKSEDPRYVSMLHNRYAQLIILDDPRLNRYSNADLARVLARDMYTKSWSAFDRLIAIVPPGGSIGLDDKLFSYWLLQPEVDRFARSKFVFRFETGVKVPEFRDLRANPRCLLENQILNFRNQFARMIHSQLPPSNPPAIAQGMPYNPYSTEYIPRRILVTGPLAIFPSISSLVGDVFNAPVFVSTTQLESNEQSPQIGVPPPGLPSRPALGGAFMARWVWRRILRPDEQHGTYEEEFAKLMQNKWAAGIRPSIKRTGAGAYMARTGLGLGIYGALDENETSRLDFSAVGLEDHSPHLRSLTNSSNGTLNSSFTSSVTSASTAGMPPSTAYTTPDPNGTSGANAPLQSMTPVSAVTLPTDDADLQLGLVKVAEADNDAFMAYSALLPEFCRLEALVSKGFVKPED